MNLVTSLLILLIVTVQKTAGLLILEYNYAG